ncbi:CIC11C00000004037 [Sungouiella intermedia]|uniref:CIC11C00000003026 n=1 Tax=Sungouiella intermedia TaxID=45354 RepID=A0A1L0FWK5_9ASCO|nr:CIC11C00000004037 [[Candida] intermedia]SGZ58701.1 CIC11C00000003026 [[Candida] intermedia]
MSEFESDVPNIPDHTLSEKEFVLQHSKDIDKLQLAEEILATIKTNNLAPYYKYLTTELPQYFAFDADLYKSMNDVTEAKISELKKVVQEAESEEETEVDVVTSTIKLAEYYTEIIDRHNAIETYNKVLQLSPSTGTKIDVLLTLARLDFFFRDYPGVSKHLSEVESLIEKGGDWERRNRYKTYQGVYYLATRNFSEAAKLLIDSLATFTSTELCSYEQVAQYSIIAGVLTLGRVDLKSKIVDSPEILSIYSQAKDLEPLVSLTNSLYTCQYNYFFQYLLQTHDQLLLTNKYLRVHSNYFLREMRCKAYAQLLESYKSLSLKSMARNFSVTEEFLDEDLCNFIPNNKLNCTIDKVNGIIETNRPDNKNSQYHQLVKQGDALLTKLQKYGAAVKLSGAERVA